ncbi:hypothetical protein AZI86_18080 [Bdellovibrio bacteriovorus]|uniref:Polysaccharide lyase n=1 Tax=Bdellovibrio bacteriovorus TaxID=959 RepID=A0A150WF93_BDEBC|nr:heparin lyase I family protein [Bdellovibrio bacteriovorus]KYG61613.1 hypothetical protein AZI86_18080 [Bdellovibrio bacteriovorus]
MNSTLLTLLLTTLFSVSALALVTPPPSKLTDCSANGWSLRRIGEGDALAFKEVEEKCVARFQISPQTAQIHNGWRAEIEDPLRFEHGTLAIYEFSTYVPTQLNEGDIPNLVFAQWHDNKAPGVAAERPPFSIRLKNGKFVLPLFNENVIRKQGLKGPGQILYAQPAVYGQWTRWKVRALWSADNKGRIEVWMNNRKVANYRGPVGYRADSTAPYFKLGIYTTESFSRPLWIYHTDYKRTHTGGHSTLSAPRGVDRP